MNLHKRINESVGKSGVKALRALEQQHLKLARYRNHLRFHLRCRDEKLTPRSLNIKNPINTKNAEDIVKRARMALVKERIRLITNNIKQLNTDIDNKRQVFQRTFTLQPDTITDITDHLTQAYEREFTKTKDRHIAKLDKLKAKANRGTINTTAPENWVHNQSQHHLTQTETQLLAKGLNYAITPDTIPYEDFILATELACQSIHDQGQKAALRNEVAGILKNAHLPHSNITKEERKAIHTLAKQDDIIILPADKGRTTVVMDRDRYTNKMDELLQDHNTYHTLKKDPTEQLKRTLKTLLKPLLADGKITKEAYNHLVPTATITPRIYGTPKIHKPDTPLRPIVDCIGSVTYNLSKSLVETIKPLLGLTEHHCKNSKELAKDLQQITIQSDEIFISHDVVSLFTKTPVEATLTIVQDRLSKDRTLRKRTKLTVADIMTLLRFVATSTYFQYNNTIYKQTEGFAMGDPLSAIMSGFFMEHLEQQAITTAPADCNITLWKRYVDDILEKIKTGHTQQLTDHLNTVDNTGSIKFTHEEETNNEIAFLDLKIHHNEDGSIKLKIHRKPTHTDQYLLWTSEHPTEHKLSVVRTLYHRATIVTDTQDRAEEEAHIHNALIHCQYPQWAIEKGRKQVQQHKTKTTKKKNQTSDKKHAAIVTLPYIRGVTERIQRAMRKHNINTPVKPHTKLRQLLVKPKDKIKPENKCNVIYEIPCLSCNNTYIGETGRSFATRKQEHKKECEKETAHRQTRAIKEQAEQENLKSAISDHCKRQNHLMDWNKARVIRAESNKYHRWIREAIEIRKRGPRSMNRDEGAYTLSHTWDSVLEKASDSRGRKFPLLSGKTA